MVSASDGQGDRVQYHMTNVGTQDKNQPWASLKQRVRRVRDQARPNGECASGVWVRREKHAVPELGCFAQLKKVLWRAGCLLNEYGDICVCVVQFENRWTRKRMTHTSTHALTRPAHT